MSGDWLPALLGNLYWLAAVLGLAGGLCGNRVAWPLLASFAFYEAALWRGWPYDNNLWAAVDCVVLICIGTILLNEWRKDRGWLPSKSDLIVLALFVPLIVSYALREVGYEYEAHILSISAAIAQLVAVFPALRAWRRLTEASSDLSGKDDFDLMVAAR